MPADRPGPASHAGPGAQFATLPSADRPTHNMWITVYTVDGTSGTLFGHDGRMDASSSSSCNATQNSAQCFTSLATVSFPINS